MNPLILFVSLLCLMLVSCGETAQPVEPAVPDTTVVGSLTVRWQQDQSVEVSWPAADPTATSVVLTWEQAGSTGARDSVQPGLDVTSTRLTGLDPTLHYDLLLTIRKSNGNVYLLPGLLSPLPLTHDAGNPSTPLRMCESASANGSGLILDPAKGGPRIAAPGSGSSDPVGSVALAIVTDGDVPPGFFEIGSAYAFPGFRDGNRWDSSVYISDTFYPVVSLADNYFSPTLESVITGTGNLAKFRLPATSTTGKGFTFFMRLGNDGIGSGRHYARVLVKADEAGRLLRGTAPNRYVELEISYQMIAGLPFA